MEKYALSVSSPLPSVSTHAHIHIDVRTYICIYPRTLYGPDDGVVGEALLHGDRGEEDDRGGGARLLVVLHHPGQRSADGGGGPHSVEHECLGWGLGGVGMIHQGKKGGEPGIVVVTAEAN